MRPMHHIDAADMFIAAKSVAILVNGTLELKNSTRFAWDSPCYVYYNAQGDMV